ncbi:hypothetical protein BH23BAC3_BH23BAC3_06130 [soil metagenome]
MNSTKMILFTILVSMGLILSFNHSANAQFMADYVTEAGDITFGVGISNGSSVGHLENSEFGITLQVFYGITEEIRGGVDYTYYFIGERDLNASEFNLNGHYFFRNRDNVIVYALGGINISSVDGDEERWGPDVDSRRFGLNAGVGLELDFGSFSLFGEPKLTLGGWTQFMITAGARVRL